MFHQAACVSLEARSSSTRDGHEQGAFDSIQKSPRNTTRNMGQIKHRGHADSVLCTGTARLYPFDLQSARSPVAHLGPCLLRGRLSRHFPSGLSRLLVVKVRHALVADVSRPGASGTGAARRWRCWPTGGASRGDVQDDLAVDGAETRRLRLAAPPTEASESTHHPHRAPPYALAQATNDTQPAHRSHLAADAGGARGDLPRHPWRARLCHLRSARLAPSVRQPLGKVFKSDSGVQPGHWAHRPVGGHSSAEAIGQHGGAPAEALQSLVAEQVVRRGADR